MLAAGGAGVTSATGLQVRLAITPVGYGGTYVNLTMRPGERRASRVKLPTSGQ